MTSRSRTSDGRLPAPTGASGTGNEHGRTRTGTSTPTWVACVLGGCLVFYVVNNGIWLLNDASSPSYDKAVHAEYAFRYLKLFERPMHLSLARLLGVTEYWPPFFHVCSVPFTMALGFSVSSVAATNLLFLVVAVFAVYGIGRRLFDERVGTGAVVITLLYPMVYVLSREVLIDFALLAMVGLSLYLILASDGGLNARRSWLLGAVVGCAMLTKWTAALFLLGPAIGWLAISVRRQHPPPVRLLVSVAIALVASAIVALPWYLTGFEKFLERAGVALGSDPAQEGDPTRIIDSLAWYWSATKAALILKPLLVPTVMGLVVFVARNRSWAALTFLLCWIVPPLVFFVLIPNKDGRFVMPLLPAVAMLAAAGIRELPWKMVRLLTWVFIVTTGLYQFYAISFGWPVTIPHFYGGPPQAEDWKVDEILTAITTLDAERPIEIAVLPNEPDFEPNIFHLAAAIRELPVRVHSVGNAPESIPELRRYDVVISKTGAIAVTYATGFRGTIRDALDDWITSANRDPDVTLWRTWPLPDGSSAVVYLIDASDGTG